MKLLDAPARKSLSQNIKLVRGLILGRCIYPAPDCVVKCHSDIAACMPVGPYLPSIKIECCCSPAAASTRIMNESLHRFRHLTVSSVLEQLAGCKNMASFLLWVPNSLGLSSRLSCQGRAQG